MSEDVLERLNEIVDDLVGNVNLDYPGVSPPRTLPEMLADFSRDSSLTFMDNLIREMSAVDKKFQDLRNILKVERRRRALMITKKI